MDKTSFFISNIKKYIKFHEVACKMTDKKTHSFFRIDTSKIIKDNNLLIQSDNKNIMQKDARPFYVAVKIDSKYSAFIPIRTKLPHSYGFITKTNKKFKTRSGLDYTKSLIVESKKIQEYLIHPQPINYKEERVVATNHSKINNEYITFLFSKYIPILQKKETERTPEETRTHDFSSLQYFAEPLREIKKNRMKRIKRKAVTKKVRKELSSTADKKEQSNINLPIQEQIKQAEQSSAKKNNQIRPRAHKKTKHKEK